MPPASKNSRSTDDSLRQCIMSLKQGSAPLPPEDLALVRHRLFPEGPPLPSKIDACLVLGSRNCGYRIRQARAVCRDQPVHYLVSGGGLMETGETEAAYMRTCLRALNVAPERIQIDEASRNTAENLRHIRPLIESLLLSRQPLNLVLVTGGFHLVRTMALAGHIFAPLTGLRLFAHPAYGPDTAPDTWHKTPAGRAIIAEELGKILTP